VYPAIQVLETYIHYTLRNHENFIYNTRFNYGHIINRIGLGNDWFIVHKLAAASVYCKSIVFNSQHIGGYIYHYAYHDTSR
jgi:hypothetical protein